MDEGIGRRIRAARAFARVSQPDLAGILELSEGTVKATELGKRAPKRSELLAIAEACKVPMWFLEGGWDGWRSIGSVEGGGPEALERAAEDLRREHEQLGGRTPSSGSRAASG